MYHPVSQEEITSMLLEFHRKLLQTDNFECGYVRTYIFMTYLYMGTTENQINLCISDQSCV